MKSKQYIHATLMLLLPVIMQAQTMQWIPTPAQSTLGKCSDQSTKSGMTQCYVLEYTPAVSGLLTSYTTGFLVSCTSLGSAIAKNQSCSMTANSRVLNGCDDFGTVLLNCSGNSGNITNNQVVAGIPVILHQLCLTIPSGEVVTLEEDPVTDLTTSIDLGNNMFVTEFPVFETATFKKPRYDDATLSAFLDFQGRSAGNLISQLDWSAKYQGEGLTYVIQRSFDGETFEQIGTLEGHNDGQQIGIYQFLDKGAQYGTNYYRLLQVDDKGKESYSPVREVLFEEYPFSVVASPNPAKEKLYVNIGHAKEPGDIKLVDVSGYERLIADFELSESNLIIELGKLEPGVYNLQVTSGKDVYVEKIVVIR